MKADELNSSEGNSCEALKYRVGSGHYDYRSWMSSKAQEQRDQVESISLLLNAGVRWNPYTCSQSAPDSRVEAVEYHISCKSWRVRHLKFQTPLPAESLVSSRPFRKAAFVSVFSWNIQDGLDSLVMSIS